MQTAHFLITDLRDRSVRDFDLPCPLPRSHGPSTIPPVPIFVGRRITIEKQRRVTLPYACVRCGYRTEIPMVVTARGRADGSIVRPAHEIEAEAEERADAALADEVRDTLDLVPCPRCGGRSDDAALYRQNTVLAVIGWIFTGAAMGLFVWVQAASDRPGGALYGLIFWTTVGILLAGATWYRRQRRIARAAQLLSEDDGASAVERGSDGQ
jgi:hypothetical protein